MIVNPRVEVFHLCVPGRGEVIRVLGRVVRHQQHRRIVEAVDQQAGAFVQRRVERSTHRGASVCSHPALGALQEGAGRRFAIGLEETECPKVVVIPCLVIAVVDRRDASDRRAVADGEKQLHVRMLEERILARIESLAFAQTQRRHPVRMRPVFSVRKVDELGARRTTRHFADFDHNRDLGINDLACLGSRELFYRSFQMQAPSVWHFGAEFTTRRSIAAAHVAVCAAPFSADAPAHRRTDRARDPRLVASAARRATDVRSGVPRVVHLRQPVGAAGDLLPTSIWVFWLGLRAGISVPVSIVWFVAGLATWTFMEYVIHRFSFHFAPRGRFGVILAYLIHGVHHAYPEDHRRWVMPPAVSVPIALVLYFAFRLALGRFINPLASGVALGYLVYDLTHYVIHRGRVTSKIGRFLRSHHMQHHYSSPERRFGVSSPFWDYVFRTHR